MRKSVTVIGGGAAGFFAALSCAAKNPDYHITILEKSSQLLQKVKISGGGRCNVTHYCFDAKTLVKNYPRGEKQLLGPFTRFGPSNLIDWFEMRGVELKIENDGRVFPVSDSSQTIIDCFLREANALNISIRKNFYVETLNWCEDQRQWQITANNKDKLQSDVLIVTTGSSQKMWNMLSGLGHTVVPPVPSLFTFNIHDERIKGLEGLSMENAEVRLLHTSSSARQLLAASGPLLITHWGLSGPAILKLSAWGAKELAGLNYVFHIHVNWISEGTETAKANFMLFKKAHPKKNVITNPLFGVPKRLWERLVQHSGIEGRLNYADISSSQTGKLIASLTATKFSVSGKSTFKDEFVTAGGIDLNEVDFKTMQSKKYPALYFAGEVLNIDAITGGFNFQSAWTTGWIAGTSV